jgi:hypothetical protein
MVIKDLWDEFKPPAAAATSSHGSPPPSGSSPPVAAPGSPGGVSVHISVPGAATGSPGGAGGSRAPAGSTDGTMTKGFAFLKLHVDAKLQPVIRPCQTAHEAWCALERAAKPNRHAKALDLHRQLAELAKQPGEDVQSYIARALQLQADMAEFGEALPDHQLCWKLLGGCKGAEYRTIMLTCMANQTELTLDVIQPMLVAVEAQFGQPNRQEGDAAAMFSGRGSRGGRDRGSGRDRSGGRDLSDRQCWYCYEYGHIRAACPRREADRASGIFRSSVDGGDPDSGVVAQEGKSSRATLAFALMCSSRAAAIGSRSEGVQPSCSVGSEGEKVQGQKVPRQLEPEGAASGQLFMARRSCGPAKVQLC